MSTSNEPKLFDGKMILGIALVMFFWIGYQKYLENKYPEAYKKPNAVSENKVQSTAPGAESDTTKIADNTDTGRSDLANGSTAKPEDNLPERTLKYEDDNLSVVFSSRGMSVVSLVLKKLSDRDDNPIEFKGTSFGNNFETNIVGRRAPIDFDIRMSEDSQVYGEAIVGDTRIKKTINIDSASYVLDTRILVERADENFSGIVTKITSPIEKSEGGSFFTPQLEHQEYYINFDEGDEDRVALVPDQAEKESYSKVSIVGLASQYFATAIVNNSDILPDFTGSSSGDGAAIGTLTHMMLNRGQQFSVNYKAFAGPKSWDLLDGVDSELTGIINFGFFKTIAHWIFQLLRSIHAVVGNWGIAIVLLTLLVRVLVLPFNVMSYKSMKAMAKIQPQMKSIREKYKNDPQRANQEIMAVMKEAKANPLGGCLPMFLQIPVFFALYQVLGQSIELYKAPFLLWVSDLSQYDPFFVFPVGMGVTMFIQQKITPSTLEPAQQKILMIMPIFLTVILATLPSGLTLYMFVSTLFGVLQQLYFMKGDNQTAKA